MKIAKIPSTLVIGFGIFIIIVGCAASDKDLDEIRISLYKGEASALVYLAQSHGFFADNGLEAEIFEFPSGRDAFINMENGGSDYATATSTVFVDKHSVDPSSYILASVAQGEINEYLVPSSSHIQNHTDLSGTRIGITFGSAAEVLLKTDLLLNGIDYRTLELVNIEPNPDAFLRALSEGSIDVAYTWNPNIFIVAQNYPGETRVIPGQTRNPFHFLLVSTAEPTEQRNEISARMLTALLQADEYVKDNPTQVQNELAQLFSYSAEYMEYSRERHRLALDLTQALLFNIENEINWKNEQLPEGEQIQFNLMQSFNFAPMEQAAPQAISIIR